MQSKSVRFSFSLRRGYWRSDLVAQIAKLNELPLQATQKRGVGIDTLSTMGGDRDFLGDEGFSFKMIFCLKGWLSGGWDFLL